MPKKAMETLTESMYYVLMALNETAMCGIDIADAIERHTKGRVKLGPATLYTVLGKFEGEGYIREVALQGRKRTYEITDKGRAAYKAEVERLKQCIRDAQTRMEGRVSDGAQSFGAVPALSGL